MSRRPKWVKEEVKFIELKLGDYETRWSDFLNP